MQTDLTNASTKLSGLSNLKMNWIIWVMKL